MAIDIFNPPQGGPWGPGIPFQVRDINRVETLTAPVILEVHAYDLTLVNTSLYRMVFRSESAVPPVAVGLFGDTALEHTYLPSLRTLTLDGAPVELRARLLDQGGAHLVEEKAQPMVWDASYAWALPSSTTQGGFTPTDRSNLALVLGAVRTVLPASIAGGPQLAMQAIDLLRGPPRSLLRPFGSLLLEGRGSIPTVPAGALFSFGGTWSWFTVPAGFGMIDGTLTHYHQRILQLVVVREGADDSTYIDLELQENAEGGHVLWQVPSPTEVQYDLPPGVVALWRWLV